MGENVLIEVPVGAGVSFIEGSGRRDEFGRDGSASGAVLAGVRLVPVAVVATRHHRLVRDGVPVRGEGGGGGGEHVERHQD